MIMGCYINTMMTSYVFVTADEREREREEPIHSAAWLAAVEE
jgi:hypothetical protein